MARDWTPSTPGVRQRTDRRRPFVWLAIFLAAVLAAGSSNAKAEDDFKPIFDGKSLDGWHAADMSYWSVEDGAITATASAEHPCTKNQYLVWQGGDLDDFELKLKFRNFGTPGTNSGFQYRSRLIKDDDIAGYQVDTQRGSEWLVRLYDEYGRDTMALRGQKATYDAEGQVTFEPIEDQTGPADFKLEDWHEYHLIARGPSLVLKVNDRLVAEVLDGDPKQRDLSGVLALQLHSGPPMTVQFKDILLRKLPVTHAGDEKTAEPK